MTNKKDFTFLSTDGATQLHGILWEPTEAAPVAVLQIAHGVAEYIDRYDDFARFLNSHGVVVAGHDHLGHGKSSPPTAPPSILATVLHGRPSPTTSTPSTAC